MLLAFLDGEPRRHVFGWAAAESVATGEAVDAWLRRKLGRWYAKRTRFEGRAGGGRYFHYGALNIGGMGSPRYGRLCVVDARPVADTTPDPVWIAEDSLRGARIRDSIGRLLWKRLGPWVAAAEQAGELAALKLAEDPSDPRPVEERVCNNNDYIEGLSLEPIEVGHVEEVRSASDDDLQQRALDAMLTGATLGESLDLGLHARVRDRADRLGIPWRQVDS